MPDYYYDIYDEIIIIDDIPSVWDQKSSDKCRVIEVVPFTGEDWNEELVKIEK